MAVAVANSVHRAVADLSVTNPLTDTLTVSSTGHVLVAVIWETAATSVSSVTVNGNSATYVTNSEAVNVANKVRWYYITGVASGSRTVSVTMSGTGGCTFTAFDVTGWDGSTITANITATAASTTDVTASGISVTAGQLLLAANSEADASRTNTWTNATEAGDSQGTSMTGTSAYYAVASTNASYSVTCTADSSTARHAMSVILLTPSVSISVDDSSIDLPQTITITKSEAWVGTVTATLGGGSITLSGSGSTTRTFSLTTANFLPGGTLNAVRWYQNVTLAVTDTNGTYNATVQVAPTVSVSEDFGAVSSGTKYITFPTGSATGDETFGFWHLGDGVRSSSIVGQIESGTGHFLPSTMPSQGRLMVYDLSGAVWLAHVDTEFFSAPYSDVEISRLEHVPASPIYRNELLWSNGFGNAAWAKNNCTVSYSSADDSWKIIPFASSNAFKEIQQNITVVSGLYYTWQWRAKADGYRYVQAIASSANFGTVAVNWDLQTGTETQYTAGTSTVFSRSITLGDDGFYLLTLTVLCLASGSARFTLDVIPQSDSTRGVTWTGDGTSAVKMRRFQAETGSTAHDYVHTETVPLRSDQVIVRSITPHNLIGYSNTLSNAYWTKTRASIGGTITLNGGALNKWGGAVLSKIVEDSTASNTHFINNTVDSIVGNPASLVSVRFLFACRASPSRRLEARLYGDVSGNYAYYRINPDTGAVSTSAVVGTASLHSCTVTQVDTLTIDGDASRPVWEVVMRLWPTTTSDTAVQNLYFFLDSGGSLTYTGDGTSGVYVGKIQVVNGYTLPEYVETTTATSPFAANVNAATLNGVSAAVAKDNLLTYSEEFSNAAWIKQGPSTVSQGRADPYGGTTAWRLTRATGVASYLQQSRALSAGTYTLQVKAKAATTGNYFAMRIQGTYPNRGDVIFNLSAGTITGAATAAGTASAASATITALANSYYLCTLTITLADAMTVLLFGPCTSSAAVASWEGSSATASDVDITEAAIHSGAVAEYVKTGSTAAYVLDRSSAIVSMPDVDEFDAAGTHVSSGWNRNLELDITDGSTTRTGVVQMSPYDDTAFGVLGPGPYVNAPTGAASGDEGYIHVISGAGTFTTDTMGFTPTEASKVRRMVYDGAAWLAHVDTDYSNDMASVRVYLSISLGL